MLSADARLLSPELAAGIRRVKGVRRLGVRMGNWLTAEQGRRLLEQEDPMTLRGLRDHAMLAMPIGCGLRRGELLALTLESLRQRDEHWVIADLAGKGGHVRTVPVPTWVKATVDAWTTAAGITQGGVFRAINKAGRVWGNGMTPKVLWEVVKAAAGRADIAKLAPHDLRRTCARLCHLAGGELDQIQFLLGHMSIDTTQRYLGCKQKLRCAVNGSSSYLQARVAHLCRAAGTGAWAHRCRRPPFRIRTVRIRRYPCTSRSLSGSACLRHFTLKSVLRHSERVVAELRWCACC